MPTPARWLAELQAHPTRHSLLAAFDLLTRLSHLSQSTAQDNLSQSTCNLSLRPPADHLSQSTPSDSPIRFTHSASLGLPLGELQAVTSDPTGPARQLVTTAIAGPLGHDTPLPLALADALDRPLPHALLDRFHHRRTLLLCHGLLAADLAANLDGHDPWSRRIVALIGLGRHEPASALRLAPIFAATARSPRALTVALRRLLPELGPNLHLRVEPLPERPTPLTNDQHTRLGAATARLGDTAALGLGVLLPGTAARLILGPVPAAARTTLDPASPTHARLCELLTAFIPEPLALELHLELEDMSLPPARLGQRALGRDLWLRRSAHATAPVRVQLPLTPARTPCPNPATRSASTTAAAA